MPLWRLQNPQTGVYLYTASTVERDNARDNLHWTDQGTACYVYSEQIPGAVPLYRISREYDPYPIDLIDGVLASASIPVSFPPVKLLSDMYVDGGVRDVVPIQSAVDLGADRIFAIVCSPNAESYPDGSFGDKHLAEIGDRVVLGILMDETVRNDIDPPRGWGVPVTTIQPSVDVHDIMTIAPGLISISMAYGYMRAADMAGLPAPEQQRCTELSDLITLKRREILAAETFARTGNVLFSADAQTDLLRARALKRELKALVDERRRRGGDGCVPGDAGTWSTLWERRPDPPIIPTPWSDIVDGRGSVIVPADSPPA